jgi:hypothetical protein
MKRNIVVLVMAAFFAFTVSPREARAGGAATGALIGGAIGLVIGTIAYIVSVSSEKTMEDHKLEKKQSGYNMPDGHNGTNSVAFSDPSPKTHDIASPSMIPQITLAFAF